MANISVKIEDQKVLHLLGLMKKRALNMRVPYREASYIMHADVIRRFETESDEKGVRWKPIRLTKQAMKRRKMLDKKGKVLKKRTVFKILQDTGRLKGSIKPKSNEFGAEVSTDVEYAAVHNFGFPKKNIPARPFMRGLSDEAKSKITRVFEYYLFLKRD